MKPTSFKFLTNANRDFTPRAIPLLILGAVLGVAQLNPPAIRADENTEKRLTPAQNSPPAELPVRIPSDHLPNAIRLHEHVISGGDPDGAEAFRELKALGVSTIICVDGARPDVEEAKKFGIKYVHLPHGYNGISKERAAQLAKAVQTFPGSIYIHCHHGKHRSPAAAAVACVGAGLISQETARKTLPFAGTSEHYLGLYKSVEQTHPLSQKALSAVPADFPEVAEVPHMAEAMVEIADIWERSQTIPAANWTPPANHPDLVPAHEVLLLREQFTELLRTEEVAQSPDPVQSMFQASEKASLILEESLRANPQDLERANKAYGTVRNNCAACHARFRDVEEP